MLEVAVATMINCSWNNPGAAPYKRGPEDALASYVMTRHQRQELTEKIRQRRYDDFVTITANSIDGNKSYTDLRNMHFASGVVCVNVDRSKWGNRIERGLVYCSDGLCLLVPTVCNNVSQITPLEHKRPEEEHKVSGGNGLYRYPLLPYPDVSYKLVPQDFPIPAKPSETIVPTPIPSDCDRPRDRHRHTVPEPGSIALIITALAALVFQRFVKKTRKQG